MHCHNAEPAIEHS